MNPQVHAQMEEKELRIENNKMIMAFMGVKPDRVRDSYFAYSDAPYFYTNDTDEDTVLRRMAEYLEYDSDWNLLMPVVVKCFDVYDLEMHEYTELNFSLNDALLLTDIKELYKTVVNFIQKYNNHLYQASLKQDSERYEDTHDDTENKVKSAVMIFQVEIIFSEELEYNVNDVTCVAENVKNAIQYYADGEGIAPPDGNAFTETVKVLYIGND